MADLSTPVQPLPSQQPLVEASLRRGMLEGQLLVEHLQALGILSDQIDRKTFMLRNWPVLMELMSVMRFNEWVASGLCDSFPNEAEEAYAALEVSMAAFAADRKAFRDIDGLPPFTEKIFDLWQTKFAWSGLEDLKADVLLQTTPADEETTLREFADFLLDCVIDLPKGDDHGQAAEE